MNRYLDKVAGVAEDQARETIFNGNQDIRPYHNLTPEFKQLLESGAVAGSAYLGSKALANVHSGFGKAAPGVALASGLYSATGLGSKLKASDREQERLIASLIRNRARDARDAREAEKMQKTAADGGYFDAAAVGGVSGGLTGALLGGSVGVAGGEATRDARSQAANITKGIGDYLNSIPFVKSNVPPIEVPSRSSAILQGIGKGVKYGVMAGVPLGASLFMYNNYKQNQEANNPYLHKIAEVTVGQTVYDDAMTGAKVGTLVSSAPSLLHGNPIKAVGQGIVGGLGGMAVGALAGIPHGLLRNKQEDRAVRHPLIRQIANDASSDAKEGLKIGSGIGAGLLGLGGGIVSGKGMLDIMKERGIKVPTGKLLAAGLGTTATMAGIGAIAGGTVGGLGGLAMGVPHGAASSLIKDYKSNKYLDKVASEDWRPDSYAHRLGWEDPRKAALRSAALTGLSYAPYASDMKTGDKVMAGSMAALSASGAHSEAEMKNQILREILEAQEHGVRHGDMDLHHELKEEIMSDPESSKWAGRVLGGLVSAAAGGSLAHAVGGNGLAVGAGAVAGGVLGGLGFGALGHYSAEADNRRVQGILDAREAYLRAKMVKQAEEAPEHSYKPAITAGAIDAGMGLGLGALGQQISKRYLGGKYAPLVIGGLEGTAAMAATDMYQRSHEAQMAELQARLRG